MTTTTGTKVATNWEVVDMEREIRRWLTERRFCLILEPTDIPEALWICSIFRFKPKGRHGKARPLKRQREGY